MVSGSISPRYSRYFSPFPHGTCSLSVSQEYLALPDGAGRFRRDFTCPRPTQDTATAQKLTNTGLSPSTADLPKSFSFVFIKISQSYNPNLAVTKLVWAVPRSLATTNGITNCFLFLRVLRCFSSPGSLLSVTCLQHAGLPHSEICGSNHMC